MTDNEFISVPRATYEKMAEIIRLWDASLLYDTEHVSLCAEAEAATVAFCGSEAGSRMEEPLRQGSDESLAIELAEIERANNWADEVRSALTEGLIDPRFDSVKKAHDDIGVDWQTGEPLTDEDAPMVIADCPQLIEPAYGDWWRFQMFLRRSDDGEVTASDVRAAVNGLLAIEFILNRQEKK